MPPHTRSQDADCPESVKGQLLQQLRELLRTDKFVAFRQPVDTSVEVTYSSVVSSPMDLSTLADRVRRDHYGADAVDSDAFLSDLALIWNNCYKYNGREHEISHVAKEMQQWCRSHIVPIVSNGRTSAARKRRRDDSPPKSDQCTDWSQPQSRADLSVRMHETGLVQSPEGLLSVALLLRNHLKPTEYDRAVLVMKDEGVVHLRLDTLPPKTLDELSSLCTAWTQKRTPTFK